MKQNRGNGVYAVVLSLALLLLAASVWTTERNIFMARGLARMNEDQTSNTMLQVLKNAETLRGRLAELRDSLRGIVTDTAGVPIPGVVVSAGVVCVKTDSAGRYAMHRHTDARWIFYTVPSAYEVPVNDDSLDRTARFYQPISKNDSIYNFTLTPLANGPEQEYRMIVIGDPQATNAQSPYYTGPDDNPVEQSDLWRFTNQTMRDIALTIDELPDDMPVYGLSMGDDVQYYGGYNDSLELQMRRAMGTTRMRLFSVIGNHDQDGKQVYRQKWESVWGPTDYSFDRGNEHYVCLNNCYFYHGARYYSPGELTDLQMAWLTQDLELADTAKRVVLCYHIPLTFGNNPIDGAQPLGVEGEDGHYSSARLSEIMRLLSRFKGGYELFCGHTHFAINHEIDFEGQHIMEHCHAAACGTIWQSNINICGTPNGYYVYSFRDSTMTTYYKGTDWRADQQMTLFRADSTFNGESYVADWELPEGKNLLVANVFNADSRWQVVAVENGREYPMTRLQGKGQDAFSVGYHHKYATSTNYWFVSKQNSYLIMNHLYYYEPQSPDAVVEVRATDPWGRVYTETSRLVTNEPYHNFAHYYYREYAARSEQEE